MNTVKSTFKNTMGQILFILLFVVLGRQIAFSQTIDFGDNSTDFGLFPTTPDKKHVLPN